MQESKPPEPDSPALPYFSKLNGKSRTILCGSIITLVFLALGISYPSAVNRINNATTDFQIGLLPAAQLPPTPLIVEVDEQSLASYGQWPWPRYQVARLLAAIRQAGAAAVGVDAVFAEPDRTSPVAIQQAMKRDLNQALPLTYIDPSFWNYDAILGKTLTNGPFVLSYFFSFDKGNSPSNPCLPKSASGAFISTDGNKEFDQLHHAADVICNVLPIQESAHASGFINSSPDSDGIYRRTPLLIEYKGRLYPSLALQTFLSAHKLDNYLLSSTDSGLALQAGKLIVPLDKSANLLIKFPTKGQQFTKISAADVLSGNFAQDFFKDKIVFIGFSAAGLHEYRPTPYSPQFLGVEFHATIVDNFIRRDFLQRPENSQTIELVAAAILSLALFIGLAGAGLASSISIPCLLAVLLIASSQFVLLKSGTVISPALPAIMVLVSFLMLALLKYIGEYLRAKQMALLVARTQEGIIGSFCSMSEYRDPETGAHIKRTQAYIKVLAQHLQQHPQFKEVLDNDTIELLFKAAPLHDIGKIGIRDHILLKNDRLDDKEFLVMKSHPQIGADIIKSVAAQIGWNPFMQVAYQICLYHQEKWDGSGYPQGLSGENIPLAARFMALADVYDALISKRVYKPAFSHQKAVAMIIEGKGKHFDPLLIEGFAEIHEQFKTIALSFLDSEEQRLTLLANNQ